MSHRKEIERKKILGNQEYDSTVYQNLWDIVQTMLRGNFMAIMLTSRN